MKKTQVQIMLLIFGVLLAIASFVTLQVSTLSYFAGVMLGIAIGLGL